MAQAPCTPGAAALTPSWWTMRPADDRAGPSAIFAIGRTLEERGLKGGAIRLWPDSVRGLPWAQGRCG